MHLSHVYVYLCSRHCFLCMFSDSDLSIYMYLLDFRFTVIPLIFFILLVIAPACLNHITWSCTRVTAWYARHLVLSYVIVELHLTTLDSHVQIQEHALRWPYCSWSEGVAEAWISGSHRSPFLPAPLLISSRDSFCCSWAPLSFWLCLSFCISYFCILWWCNIL